jgi:hypothetical protein
MTNAITTTVTWQDLLDAQHRDIEDLREAYDELRELAREEYGDDALQTPTPDDLADIEDEDVLRRAVYQQQAEMYERSAKQLQKRVNLLEYLRGELGDGAFEIKMLSGQETMQTEVDLRTDAQASDADSQTLQLKRNQKAVDAATVDAPDGVPRDDDGSPTPSECPNALVNTLYQKVEQFNSAGDPDFRAAGFGGDTTPDASVSSAAPTPASEHSESSVPTESDSQPRGDSQ